MTKEMENKETREIRYIYKIVLTKGSFAGKYYIGQHTAKIKNNWLNEDELIKNPYLDKYSGSGLLIRRYFKKYNKIPRETFFKYIICFAQNKEELSQLEKTHVGCLYKNDGQCLNRQAGGGGYVTCPNKKKSSSGNWWKNATQDQIDERKKAMKIATSTEDYKIKQRLSHIGKNTWAKGSKHTEEWKENKRKKQIEYMKDPEHRKNVSLKLKGKNKGPKSKEMIEKMRQTKIGKIYVVNKQNICKMIAKEELDNYLLNGFIRGRIYKNSI